MTERSIEDVTKELGEAHDAKSRLEKLRKEFFALATEEAKQDTLAQKTVSVDFAADESKARDWLAKHYPTWDLVEFRFDDDLDEIFALLRENPEYIKWVVVNPIDGRVYQKTVTGGDPLLDDERLRAEDPDLWKQISYEYQPPSEERVRTRDELTDDQFKAMQKYMYPAPPGLRLPAPRKAKKEELDAAG